MVSEMLKYRIYHKIIGILFGYYRILPYLCQCNIPTTIAKVNSSIGIRTRYSHAIKPEAE